jgi:hypothetical protein
MTVLVTAAVECNGINCPILGEAYTYVIPLAERIALDLYPLVSLII